MLILPLPRAPDWRKPPVVTLLIIMLCTFIFFGPQGDDDRLHQEAWKYYVLDSGLADIELPRYRQWLEDKGQSAPEEPAGKMEVLRYQVELANEMHEDSDFMQELKHGRQRPDEADWQQKRNRFEDMLQQPVTTRYGFSPAKAEPVTWLSHMFLHGSESHLLGNMVILFIAGYMVEHVLGGVTFLVLYLLAGVGACAFDLFMHAGRLGVGIGASGAISGVMAMYVGLFRLQKVRFFYWILFYADFFRAPALAILPLWVAQEAWQMWANPDSHINYAAHMGGFASGAVLALVWLLLTRRKVAASVTEAAPVDVVQRELDAVARLVGSLQIDRALEKLQQLATSHPRDARVTRYYFNVAKAQPASEHLHAAAALALPMPDPTGEQTRDLVQDYLKLARPAPRLSPDLLAGTARRLLRAGFFAEGDTLLRALQAAAPRHSLMPELLLLLARLQLRRGDQTRLQATLARLRQEFPDTEEARLSQRLS